MVGVFAIHVTLSDSSDDRAVLYYVEELIFLTAFVSIQGLYPRVPAHHFCVKSGVLIPVSREQNQVSRDHRPSSNQTKTISLIGNHFW